MSQKNGGSLAGVAAAARGWRRPGVRGRRSGKGSGIAGVLRQLIADGRLKPGQRLPTRRQLQQQFHTSPITIHRVLEQLQADGFICARSTRGTFVADVPPFQRSYGLVLPQVVSPRMEGSLALFNRDLYLEADRLRRTGQARFRIYQAVHRGRDEGQIQAVIRALEHHLLAGLILAVPWTVRRSGLEKAWKAAGVPVVGLCPPAHALAGVACVASEPQRWFDRAFERLARLGRRRVAVLMDATGGMRDVMQRSAARFGMTTQPSWTQFVDTNHPFAAGHVAQLLMQAADRPDALLILDDALVESAVLGLREAGVDTTNELHVIGHCNYPQVTPTALPIERLGFDVARVLGICTGLIDQARAGRTPPPVTRFRPIFQDEYESAGADPAGIGSAGGTDSCAQTGVQAPI